MRYLAITLTSFFLLMACTPKDMSNNKHDETPIYEENPNIQPKKVESVSDVVKLYELTRPMIKSEKQELVLQALEKMEPYLLNLENLSNPEIHSRGTLHKSYLRLMNLYGYGMTIAINKYPSHARIDQLLKNYRATVFNSCNLDNMDCQTAAAFKGPYGVNILSHLVKKDVKRLKNIEGHQKAGPQAIKNLIFSLYVLKAFNENKSSITQELFIDFSSVFFKSVDISDISEELLKNYLFELQNMMVQQASREASPESCAIFQDLSRHQLNHIGRTLDKGFVAQFNNHYYRCHSPEQIVDRIVADEEDIKKEAQANVTNKGAWSEFKNDYHSRQFIMENNHSDILSHFAIQSDISLPVLHLMDNIYYGRLGIAEQEALLNRLSDKHLLEFVSKLEDYAQLNFLYGMQYTFNIFNEGLTERFDANKTINKKFVQEVYDHLWSGTGDMWIDYRRRVTRLRQGLSDVYYKLPPEKREALHEKWSYLKDNKLEDTNITNLINIAVTYPIVLATTYFTGVDGGGTIEIRVSWARGADNTIEISTVKPLSDYFRAFSRNTLQLLDYGTIGYQPREYERSYGLAVAIKSGFFDTVNLDLGAENKGLKHNLKLFFERYVDNNRTYAEIAQREIEDLRKLEDNHWPKLTRICEAPITGERRIDVSALYQNFYLNSKEAGTSISTYDLEYAHRINSLQTKIEILRNEIDKMRRTYQVVLSTLKEKGDLTWKELQKEFQVLLVPHFSSLKILIEKRALLLKDIQKDKKSCLYTANRIERFQQNLMQKQAVLYLARVHAAMTFNTPNSELFNKVSNGDGAAEIKDYFSSLSIQTAGGDSYQQWVIEQMTMTQVLNRVETDLGLKGKKLLAEALNLILSPHNLDSDFGIEVRGLKTRATSLSDATSFLPRRGGFDSEYFILSDQDQRLRVREELFDLKAMASDLAQYVPESNIVKSELKALGYDGTNDVEISLNSNLTIFLKNFQYFKDQMGKTERQTRVRYKSNREQFVQEGLEKLFGNNQEGNQIFNWTSQYSDIKFLRELYARNLETYMDGPVYLPKNLDPENPKLDCALNHGFDYMNENNECQKYSLQAKQIIDEFVRKSEFFYLEIDELSPMLKENGSGELDELSDLVANTLLNSEYLYQYKPNDILRYFRYYKKKNEPNEWTWFDQFLAKEFTTVTARDNKMQSVNIPMLPGTAAFERFFEEEEQLQFDSLLIDFENSTRRIFRNFYRAEIFKFMNLTDAVIDEVISREYTTTEKDWPLIKFRREDVADINTTNGREWIELEIKKRDNGSLILLQDRAFEMKVYEDQQKLVLEEFECNLMPKLGDLDFSQEAQAYIDKSARCEGQVSRWMSFKKCEQIKSRKQQFPQYDQECVSSLGGN